MLNRFKKTVKKLNNSTCYIAMPKSEEDKEYYVLTEKELELILGRKIE
jgi:hypothetical protein